MLLLFVCAPYVKHFNELFCKSQMVKRLFFFLERDDSSDEDEEISNHITKANKGLYDPVLIGPDNVYSDRF